jgi:four helix bundle protein
MSPDRPDPAFSRWVQELPRAVTSDSLWRLKCYQHALFLFSLSREDAIAIHHARPFGAVAEQLARSVGSIPANMAEAYGRPTNSDRIRFFSYALGSVREATAWYDGARAVLDPDHVADRLERLSRVRAMLIGLLARLHGGTPNKKLEPW